jgi:hypothetical protein
MRLLSDAVATVSAVWRTAAPVLVLPAVPPGDVVVPQFFFNPA